MDLFGSDLPVEADEGMQFAWSDGILLQVCLYSSSRMNGLLLSNQNNLHRFAVFPGFEAGIMGAFG